MKPVEPVAVVVAKAKVKGAAQIELQPLGEIQARPLQPVHVKYLYRLEELSKDKETWRFQLASKVGVQAPAPVRADWEDRWGRNDSLWGVLQQEFVFDKPGTYEGSFQVHALYGAGEWRSGAVATKNEKTAQGTFKVKVL